MKVYTKGGDKGSTSLIGGERVSKCDVRVEAYGTVDELTAFTALLADKLARCDALAGSVAELRRIESQLMTVQALLAVGDGGEGKVAPLPAEAAQYLEQAIDAMQECLPAITKFTIPGGDERISMCHVCRTVCRRAERALAACRRRTYGRCRCADISEPAVGLFLCSGPHGDSCGRCRGDSLDTLIYL